MSAKDCLFCKMIAGAIPIDRVYEDEEVLAFRDIRPQAPTHILIIPKEHVSTVADVDQHRSPIMTALTKAANLVAVSEGIDQSGYRLVVNCRDQGGQEVYHLHMHLLGGRAMTWPPG